MNGSVEDETTPPFVGPHDGRELELMLAGKKPLSMFSADDAVEYENYPDKRFDILTSKGRFVKESSHPEISVGQWRGNARTADLVRNRQRGLADSRDADDSGYIRDVDAGPATGPGTGNRLAAGV